MCPFSVTLHHVPDRELGPLLTHLAAAGFHDPVIKPVSADRAFGRAAPPARGRRPDLPEDWRPVREREEALHVPVYLGDAMQWNLSQIGALREVMLPVPGEGPLHVPAG